MIRIPTQVMPKQSYKVGSGASACDTEGFRLSYFNAKYSKRTCFCRSMPIGTNEQVGVRNGQARHRLGPPTLLLLFSRAVLKCRSCPYGRECVRGKLILESFDLILGGVRIDKDAPVAPILVDVIWVNVQPIACTPVKPHHTRH